MAQNIKISLQADNQTQPAVDGVDRLAGLIEKLITEWKKAGDEAEKAGKKGSDGANKPNEPIKKQTGLVNELRQKIKDLEVARDKSFDPKAIQKFNKSIEDANKELKKMTTATAEPKKNIGGIGEMAKTAAGPLLALFAVDKIMDFGKAVLNTRAEFQKFEATLTNTLGSNSAAVAAMSMIQDFASTTPFGVAELTSSFVRLANQGFKPNADQMRSLGDLASSTGKSFDQLAEAALDAFTGENERLKEFGITAKKQGDITAFTFKGVTTQVKNTREEVQKYILSLGKLEGVSGSMAAVSKTLGGQISNLGDNWDQLLNNLGGQTEGVFSMVIGSLSSFVGWMAQAVKSTKQLDAEWAAMAGQNYGEQFAKMTKEQQSAEEDWLIEHVKKQKETLERLQKERADRNQKELDAANKTNRIFFKEQESAEEKLFRQLVASNEAKLDAIEAYYDEEKKKAATAAAEKADPKKIEEAFKNRMKELDELEKLAIREAELEGKSNTQIHLIELAFNEERLKTLRDFGKKATNEYKSYTLEQKEIIKENEKELREIILRSHDKRYKDQQDFNKIMKSAQDKSIDDLVAKEEWAAEQRDKLKREEAERKKQIEEESYNVSVQFMDALFQIGRDRNQQALADNDARRQEELKRVGDDAQAKAFINAKFDRENAKLKQKQAVADKANALFGIAINTAMAIVKQLATTPLPVGAPLVALIAASGAIQAALVASRPIPKYKEGTEFVRRLHGEPMGRDTILAHIDEGERIVPREINRQLTGIKNSELPRLARVAKEEKIMVAEFRELVAQQKETNRTLKNLKLYRTDLTEQGIVHTVESNNARTKILNEQFSL